METASRRSVSISAATEKRASAKKKSSKDARENSETDIVSRLTVGSTTAFSLDEERISISSNASKKGKKKKKQVIDEGFADYDIEELILFEDDSLSEDESIYSIASERSTVTVQPDFFDQLGSIPSLSQVSPDVSIDAIAVPRDTKTSTALAETEDVGKFVDPLTGHMLQPSEEHIEVVEEEEVKAVAEEEEEESKSSIPEDDELLQLVEVVEEEIVVETQKTQEEAAFETFVQSEAVKKIKVSDEVDQEMAERLEAERQLRIATKDFLQEIIDQVVDGCERMDSKKLMRQNLDKVKLMDMLLIKMDDMLVEDRVHSFLHGKVVEFFRRKKKFRPILEDSPDTIEFEIEKYKYSLHELDAMLGRYEETKRATSESVEALTMKFEETEERAIAEVQRLEELVKKTFHRDNFDKLKNEVEVQLGKMAKLRNEITKERFLLIDRQHITASLMTKVGKLENLGNNLRMKDFAHLQTEVQALGKKIEERNAELTKLRMRYDCDMHHMAHLKDKQKMMRNTIEVQKKALKGLILERRDIRQTVFDLKMKREKIRKKMEELSFQGGLLDKPDLMHDYDETAVRLDDMRNKVDELRSKINDMQFRVDAIRKHSLSF